MSKLKYKITVVSLGELAQEFIDSGILVFFGLDAPEELAEFSILHQHDKLYQEIVPGDIVKIDNETFKILAVGEVANQNIANLGHLILKFNGYTEAEMPGDVSVENVPVPVVKPGTVIEITAGQ